MAAFMVRKEGNTMTHHNLFWALCVLVAQLAVPIISIVEAYRTERRLDVSEPTS